MAKTQYLNYTIALTDAALVLQLQGAVHAGGAVGATIMAPTAAATLYGAPIQENNVAASYPSIRSEWFAGSNNFPRNVRTFDRCNGGWFGICFLFGTTTHYYWRGTFAFVPKLDAPFVTGIPAQPMAERRWLDGAEWPNSGEVGTGNMTPNVSRAASRHLQGYGYKFDSTALQVQHIPTESGLAAVKGLWERFYIRVWRYDIGQVAIWRTAGAISPLAGVELSINAAGQLLMTNITSAGTRTIKLSASTLPIGVWKKIDVIYTYGTSGYCRLFVNGLDVGKGNMAAGEGGLAQDQNLGTVNIGPGVVNGLTFDIDDWRGCTIPADPPFGGANPPDYTATYPLGAQRAHDWENGSRIAAVGAFGFGSDHAAAAWTGDWRLLRQRPSGNITTERVVGSTSGARLTIATDAAREVDGQVGGVGIAAMVVNAFNLKAAGISGSLGYRLPGGAAVMTAIVQQAVLSWNQAFFRPSIVTPLTPLAGLELIFDHPATVNQHELYSIGAVVDIIGKFGPEDLTPQPSNPALGEAAAAAVTAATIKPMAGLHNAPYPHSPWARKGTAPFSPFAIVAGTYAGTGTFKDLTFRQPVHWLFVRPTVGGNGGVQWWSTMVQSRLGYQRGNNAPGPAAMVEVLVDPNFGYPAVDPALNAQEQQTIVRMAGANVDCNQVGTTYQYVAICDPGQRFLTSGALAVFAGTVDVVHALTNDSFTPEAVFVMQEKSGNDSVVGMLYKGLGHAADNISPVSGAEIAGLRMGLGTLTSKSALMLANIQQLSYMAFRRADGNNDAGQPAVLWLANYVGDGAASRTINFAPASGKRPLWALVVGHTGTSIMRDPSHTGVTSTTLPNTANATTGITGGGIDSLSVGVSLNANGVTYDVFVIPGDSVALNGGFSQNGEFQPVAPDSPIAGNSLWDATPADPELAPNEPSGTVVVPGVDPVLPDGVTGSDFQTTCVAATTFIINQALSHIGVNKQIGNITTEASALATTCRLHYTDDVLTVLRDFPWPFATRYARLVLVAGTATVPVNGDWQYSYRAPSDSIFNRRIVNPDLVGRAFDPDPPKFRVGSDATGLLIYTNEAPTSGQPGNVTPELEYTVRTTCVALQGDSVFREALGWRHAFSICAALAKDPEKRGPFCWQMYQSIKATARTLGAQEKQDVHDGDADWITGRE